MSKTRIISMTRYCYGGASRVKCTAAALVEVISCLSQNSRHLTLADAREIDRPQIELVQILSVSHIDAVFCILLYFSVL